MTYKNGELVQFRGQAVRILRPADANGLLYYVRFPDGTTGGVRNAELSALPKDYAAKTGEIPVANASQSIPAAIVGLKQKIARFDPRDYKSFVEIMKLARSLEVLDLNQMAQDLNVTGSTVWNWLQGSLRPPNRVMVEALKQIDRGISAAVVLQQERARERRQQEINDGLSNPVQKTATEQSLGSVNEPAYLHILDLGSSTYTIEIREGANGLSASCKERPNLQAKAGNRVDLLIDMKALLLNAENEGEVASSPPAVPQESSPSTQASLPAADMPAVSIPQAERKRRSPKRRQREVVKEHIGKEESAQEIPSLGLAPKETQESETPVNIPQANEGADNALDLLRRLESLF